MIFSVLRRDFKRSGPMIRNGKSCAGHGRQRTLRHTLTGQIIGVRATQTVEAGFRFMNFLDILIMLGILAFIVVRLRGELGNKNGNEEEISRFPRDNEQADMPVRPRPMPRTSADKGAGTSSSVIDMEANPKLREAYKTIRRQDPDFDPSDFLEGAKAIYPMIMNAFWQGDRDVLRIYVDDVICKNFEAAIDQRTAAGERVEGRVVNLNSVEITDARLNGPLAEVTVTYKADLASVTYGKDGTQIDGDMSDTFSTHDIWTFARNTRSDDRDWSLVKTQSGN